MKRKISILMIMMLTMILASLSVFAQDQPNQPEDPFVGLETLSITGQSTLPNLDITASPLSIMGSQCSNLYSTTGEYCSGHLRVYYQCLETMDGGQWQQRTENCGDYPGGGRCIEEDGQAKCVDYLGETEYGKKMLYWGIGLLFLGGAAGYFIHPILFLVVIYGIYIIVKFFMGGV